MAAKTIVGVAVILLTVFIFVMYWPELRPLISSVLSPTPTATIQPTPSPITSNQTTTPTPQPTPEPIITKNITRVFTWISHAINESAAKWLYDMNFTDVAIRYTQFQEINSTKANLDVYGIKLWYVISPWLYGDAFTKEDFVNIIEAQQNQKGVPYLVLDDIHVVFEYVLVEDFRRVNFLSAVESFGDNITVTLYENSVGYLSKYNFTNLNVDLYGLPSNLNETVVMEAKSLTKTLGVYLWLWNERNWENVSVEEINRVYTIAQNNKVPRFIVWMGDESDVYEKGMYSSSLSNYPNWWVTINHLNYKL